MSATTYHRPRAEARSDVLLVRVWVDPIPDEPVRARLLTGTAANEQTTTFAVAAGVDEICALVRGWLQDIEP